MMMLIDFEQKFSEHLKEYEQKNILDDDKLEEIAPDLYLSWLDSPKDWLSGKSPKSYFKAFDAPGLIESLGSYILSDIAIPGVLLNRIADTKEETHPFLISLLKNYEGDKSDEIKTIVVRLIEEMDMRHPYDYYIETIAFSDTGNDFTEACAQELKESGADYKNKILIAYEKSNNDYSSNCFLDILTDLPYDERTYSHVLDKFLYSADKKAFYASCLGKLGNDKAIPFLEEAIKQEDIVYYDYISIKNAIEELGGEINIDRDFSGDKDYESLKNMGE